MSGEAGMGREKRGKQTLRKKMMIVMLISTMFKYPCSGDCVIYDNPNDTE